MKTKDNLGLIFDVQRQCIHDGDGVRTVLFMKGCPLRCAWCANPESQKTVPEIGFLWQSCIGDGSCMTVCPENAIAKPGAIDRQRCVRCGKCVKACYPGALSLLGEWIDSEKACELVLKDAKFFKKFGGVTISGGEPFLQPKFVKDLLEKLHTRGVHTAVETSGYARREDMLEAKVDQFLFDIKLVNDEKHIYWTGCSNKNILSNLDALCVAGRRVIIRVPVIPGANDDEENLRETAVIVRKYGIEEFHILPFHQLGSSKYQMIGKNYKLADKRVPTKEHIANIVQILESYGTHPIVGG